MNDLALAPAGESAEPAVLSRGLRAAREKTRLGSRSFYFASFALDRPRRDAAYALYAFFRRADDAADAPGAANERLNRIALARAALDRVYRGRGRTELEHALRWAVVRFGIPRGPLDELLDAVEGDAGRVRVASWNDLMQYCHGVASTVGLAMAPLLGAPDHALEQAARLGRAMQLTNILRDVREDMAQDRIYLPAEAMAHRGVTEQDLRAPAPTEAFRALAREVGARARADYEAADEGIRAIGPRRSRLTVRLMRAAYREILVEIERRNYDVFRERVVISTARKAWLAARVLTGGA